MSDNSELSLVTGDPTSTSIDEFGPTSSQKGDSKLQNMPLLSELLSLDVSQLRKISKIVVCGGGCVKSLSVSDVSLPIEA